MTSQSKYVLVIDDNPQVRVLTTAILNASGYRVRSAEDGFSALIEMQKEMPDVILSDLNMPGMSGFELLSVVRRRFPAIPVVATSGAFSGEDIPDGVAADAFHQKATGVAVLLKKLSAVTEQAAALQAQRRATPIWIANDCDDHSAKSHIMVGCPNCLRTFAEHCGAVRGMLLATGCVYCNAPIQYAIVQPETPDLLVAA